MIKIGNEQDALQGGQAILSVSLGRNRCLWSGNVFFFPFHLQRSYQASRDRRNRPNTNLFVTGNKSRRYVRALLWAKRLISPSQQGLLRWPDYSLRAATEGCGVCGVGSGPDGESLGRDPWPCGQCHCVTTAPCISLWGLGPATHTGSLGSWTHWLSFACSFLAPHRRFLSVAKGVVDIFGFCFVLCFHFSFFFLLLLLLPAPLLQIYIYLQQGFLRFSVPVLSAFEQRKSFQVNVGLRPFSLFRVDSSALSGA